MIRKIAVLGLAALSLAAAAPAASRADDYPAHAVTFVVPFPPGAGTDLLARMLAQELSEKLKQPFVVENKPGAGTLLAASTVAQAKPDGYTLLMAPVTTLAINPSVYKKLPYDPEKDFTPVGLAGQAEFVLAVNPSLGVNSVQELIALAKKKPGELHYGSSGQGTPHNLFMAMFMHQAGLSMVHVPYRGSVPVITAVMSGELQLCFVDLQPALPFIRDGKLKALATPSPSRVKAMPDLPTVAESGLPGFAGAGWFAVVARAGTPPARIATLDKVIQGYLHQPAVQEKLTSLAIRPTSSTPEEAKTFIAAETKKWAQIVKDAGIKPE